MADDGMGEDSGEMMQQPESIPDAEPKQRGGLVPTTATILDYASAGSRSRRVLRLSPSLSRIAPRCLLYRHCLLRQCVTQINLIDHHSFCVDSTHMCTAHV